MKEIHKKLNLDDTEDTGEDARIFFIF